MPIVTAANPTALGSAGRPRSGVEVRVIDENDCELPAGAVGELVVRTDCPWAISHGYAGNPVATGVAWRNGWFHTGDGFKRDAGGNFYFVDRLKDAIRRRGENISSFEVESEVLAYPAIREAAAIAVKSEIAEDEVCAVVAIKEGEALDPAGLIEFLRPRMAHFMVPRYVRVVEALPRTPTAKIEKVKLRAEGLTTDTWDREAAGIVVKREKIGAKKRDFRALWIMRINAAARVHGLSYSRLIAGLRIAGLAIDRKLLADLAVNDANAFGAIALQVKAHLPAELIREVPAEEAPAAKAEPPKAAAKAAATSTAPASALTAEVARSPMKAPSRSRARAPIARISSGRQARGN